MAVVKFGGGVAGMRGTIGGITFSANGGASYAKSWARPPMNMSAGAQIQRGRLVVAATAWANLSPSDVNDWNAFAAAPNEIDYDPWGAQRFLSGFQWYVRAYQRRLAVGLGVPVAPPAGAGATQVTGLAVTLGSGPGGTCGASWDTGQFPSGTGVVVKLALSPRSGGVENWGRYAAVLGVQSAGDAGEDITAGAHAAFGWLISGWRGWIRVMKQVGGGNRSIAALASAVVT